MVHRYPLFKNTYVLIINSYIMMYVLGKPHPTDVCMQMTWDW